MIKNKNLLIFLAVLAAVVSLSFLSPSLITTEIDESFIASAVPGTYSHNAVQLTEPYGSGPESNTLQYIHCGPTFTRDSFGEDHTEMILLHGDKFNKDDWAKSGILTGLCMKGGQSLSVTAIGLSIHADEDGFADAFDALVKEGVISGHPVVVVTPSASGKAVVRLAVSAFDSDEGKSTLGNIVSIWIPIASPAVVLKKNGDLFKQFPEMGIKVLAINGDEDPMGIRATQKLVDLAGAKGVELKGGHSCYFERPEDFVQTVLGYLSMYTNATFVRV
eukprot:CAMPEP_0197246602 /NCGR_PEP_ID=MMETSP1429-20130617/17813_1 /TAXON_ID=49237 /ORGANISM="Chaetoceros  sp., Strain UNC1202" /LENGTH=275 /DNA_ID=CAMNT_0042707301 /DNA_START=69 /DNA_END=896 /DNA_ORIENTATION=+